jgi:hypothetical protein
MNAVTIDKLDIKIHERYAQDQQKLDPSYIKDAAAIPLHSEITGTSSIYSSKWEELFEIQIKNIPWAAFSPPPGYHVQARRFFSYRIAPSILIGDDSEEDEEEENEEEEEKEQDTLSFDLFNTVMNIKGEKKGMTHLIEKEKTILLDLFSSIKGLNRLLTHINARKVQYQKG